MSDTINITEKACDIYSAHPETVDCILDIVQGNSSGLF